MPTPFSHNEQKQNSGGSWLWQQRSTLALVVTTVTFVIVGLSVAEIPW
jgi:hypothetical protein